MNEVHVWRASMDVAADRLAGLLSTLSTDERQRADQFRFPRDRDHFIAARGFLREALAAALGVAPAGLSFRFGAWGKPALAGDRACGIRFNLSHSSGRALLALALEREVGVDLEAIRPEFAGEEIAQRFFSPAEAAELRALPAPLRPAAFFRCWVRKEAYIKARGQGLSLPLESFDVSLRPDVPACLLATRPDPDEAARWTLVDIDAGPGFAAALCIEGRNIQVKHRVWAPVDPEWPR